MSSGLRQTKIVQNYLHLLISHVADFIFCEKSEIHQLKDLDLINTLTRSGINFSGLFQHLTLNFIATSYVAFRTFEIFS